ncbi:MAG: hypothetical protein CVU57_03380 [Deltaproteobacteria bacterium HGW-Deltaproteobacteria-15]|nr:MAG: hypothetical protein CVU57_03380 [Deltaproteobacteria bacterium HGW-Deltaproteobacteria-15]
MAKAKIHSGICGFIAVVEATMNGTVCALVIRSECEAIPRLAKDLNQVNPFQEISFRQSMPQTIRSGMQHSPHAACPVPVGIIKTVEVEAKLALPADVTIKLSKSQA